MITCCSCGLVGEQQYACDADNVESIQIVKLEKYVEDEYRFDYVVLAKITDISSFVDKLNNVECSVNWGEPGVLSEGNVVIKLDYINGDYDLIFHNAQWFNRNSENHTGYFFFNEEQLDQLITEYSPKNTTKNTSDDSARSNNINE